MEDDLSTVWLAIGRGLAAISVVLIASEIVLVAGNSGVSSRDRLFQVSQSATAITGSFALAGVLVLLATRTPVERWRGVRIVALTVGVVTVVCSAYAVWYSLTRPLEHIPVSDSGQTFFAFVGLNWWYRMGGTLYAIAAAIMGSLVILVALRASRRRPTPTTPLDGLLFDDA
jgi:hypothetical protein